MRVRIQYLGYIRNILGKREDEFELGEDTFLSELLNKMAGKYGEAFRAEVFEPGLKDVKTGFVVTVNGVLIGQLNGVNTHLNDGDNIVLMSLMSGG